MALTKHTGACLVAIALITGLGLAGCGGGKRGSSDNASSNGGGASSSSSSSSGSSSSGGEQSSSSSSSSSGGEQSSSSSSGSSSSGSGESSSSSSSSGGVQPVAGEVPWYFFNADYLYNDTGNFVYVSGAELLPQPPQPWSAEYFGYGNPSYPPFKDTSACMLSWVYNYSNYPNPDQDPEETGSNKWDQKMLNFANSGPACATGWVDPFGMDWMQVDPAQVHYTMIAYIKGSGEANHLDLDTTLGGASQSRIKLTIASNAISLQGIDGAVYLVNGKGQFPSAHGWHTYQVAVSLNGPHHGTIKVYADANETPLISVDDQELPPVDPYLITINTLSDKITGKPVTSNSSFFTFGQTPGTTSDGHTYNSKIDAILLTPYGAYSPGQLKGKIPRVFLNACNQKDFWTTQCPELPGY